MERKGKGNGKWGDAGKSKGKGKYGKCYGKSGKGKGKRPMSSVDQAQYATMEEGDCDWDQGGGGDAWKCDPSQQAGHMAESQTQRAPWDNTRGPQYWMGEPEGGAWTNGAACRLRAASNRQ